jgi:hypothetical protein
MVSINGSAPHASATLRTSAFHWFRSARFWLALKIRCPSFFFFLSPAFLRLMPTLRGMQSIFTTTAAPLSTPPAD